MSKENMKLSEIQKNVIRKMREGFYLRWEGRPTLKKEGCVSEYISLSTARLLYKREIIFQGASFYHLTDFGKSIEL